MSQHISKVLCYFIYWLTIAPLSYIIRILPRRGALDTTLCDKNCQWLADGWWFSRGTSVSSTNKTDHHDIAEILLKVALNTITLTLSCIFRKILTNLIWFIWQHFLEDTDYLWKIHCNKDFKGSECDEMETWRELYWVRKGYHWFSLGEECDEMETWMELYWVRKDYHWFSLGEECNYFVESTRLTVYNQMISNPYIVIK